MSEVPLIVISFYIYAKNMSEKYARIPWKEILTIIKVD